VSNLLENFCAEDFENLIDKARSGDNIAFEKLMDNYIKVIYNYILVHINLQENTKDILQESMLSIWNGLMGFDNKSNFKTWIIGITRRKIADYYRKFYKNKEEQAYANDIFKYDEGMYLEKDIEQLADKIVIQNAISTLSVVEKELVYLVFNVQLSYKQIEQITGILNGTIKSKMFSIKAKLRKQLEQGGKYE